MCTVLCLSLSPSLSFSLFHLSLLLFVCLLLHKHTSRNVWLYTHTQTDTFMSVETAVFFLFGLSLSLLLPSHRTALTGSHIYDQHYAMCVSLCVCDIAKPVVDRYTQFFKSQQLQLFSYAHVNRIITITVAQPVSSSCASLHDEYILVYATSNAWNWQSVQAS